MLYGLPWITCNEHSANFPITCGWIATQALEVVKLLCSRSKAFLIPGFHATYDVV